MGGYVDRWMDELMMDGHADVRKDRQVVRRLDG